MKEKINMLIDIEGAIISNEYSEILVVPTELAYIIFESPNNILECYGTKIKYDLRKYNRKYWEGMFRASKTRFPTTFNNKIYSNFGDDPITIQKYLLSLIKKYDIVVYAKGINLEMQYLFGDLNKFHKSLKKEKLSYNLMDLNDLHFPKYDNVDNKEDIVTNFYNTNKNNIAINLNISEEYLFKTNIKNNVKLHISLLEIIVFYDLLLNLNDG